MPTGRRRRAGPTRSACSRPRTSGACPSSCRSVSAGWPPRPFAFFRGSAGLMAMDLATTPSTGLRVQACGDAHVSNFGEFATPEHTLVFDINDFDETLPGSVGVGRQAPSGEPRPRRPAAHAVRGDPRPGGRRDRSRVPRAHGGLPPSPRPRAVARPDRPRRRRPPLPVALPGAAVPERRPRPAHGRTPPQRSDSTAFEAGRRQFVEAPPMIIRLANANHRPEEALGLFAGYRASLSEDRRQLLDRFHLMDVAPEDRRDRERRDALLGGPVRGPRARCGRSADPPDQGGRHRRSSSRTSGPRRCRTTASGS